ncbi:unnamed protein product [Bursaphelenchus okinawaensis]|uniref:Uncharacterized protein n=1 Tax=Bursaphelenchus okinawaensis TaxID=465554 RepID=A0A811LN92_9BILA|nr:unnamed protein product [Bursaphelenchus okinawaensis]CAG9124672.1 unnamed protein product [Bursaphelenchus okinawaensis]
MGKLRHGRVGYCTLGKSRKPSQPSAEQPQENDQHSAFHTDQPSTSDSKAWLRGKQEEPDAEADWRSAQVGDTFNKHSLNHGQDAWETRQPRLDYGHNAYPVERSFRQPPTTVSTSAARAANSAASAAAAASRRFGGSSEAADDFVDSTEPLLDLKSCFKGPHCLRALASAAAAAAATRQPNSQRTSFPRLSGDDGNIETLARFHDHNLPLDGMASLESLIG